jgi:hypothetical protein
MMVVIWRPPLAAAVFAAQPAIDPVLAPVRVADASQIECRAVQPVEAAGMIGNAVDVVLVALCVAAALAACQADQRQTEPPEGSSHVLIADVTKEPPVSIRSVVGTCDLLELSGIDQGNTGATTPVVV